MLVHCLNVFVRLINHKLCAGFLALYCFAHQHESGLLSVPQRSETSSYKDFLVYSVGVFMLALLQR